MKQRVVALAVAIAAVAIVARVTYRTPRAADAGRLTIAQLIDIKHPSNAMWSPDGRSVVFVWDRAGISNVYVAAADGASAPRELGAAGSSLAGANWSSDGRALLVSKNGDLWRVPID